MEIKNDQYAAEVQKRWENTAAYAECVQKNPSAADIEGLNVVLAGLGELYVADERFKTNIDRHAEGMAAFVSRTIKAYCG